MLRGSAGSESERAAATLPRRPVDHGGCPPLVAPLTYGLHDASLGSLADTASSPPPAPSTWQPPPPPPPPHAPLAPPAQLSLHARAALPSPSGRAEPCYPRDSWPPGGGSAGPAPGGPSGPNCHRRQGSQPLAYAEPPPPLGNGPSAPLWAWELGPDAGPSSAAFESGSSEGVPHMGMPSRGPRSASGLAGAGPSLPPRGLAAAGVGGSGSGGHGGGYSSWQGPPGGMGPSLGGGALAGHGNPAVWPEAAAGPLWAGAPPAGVAAAHPVRLAGPGRAQPGGAVMGSGAAPGVARSSHGSRHGSGAAGTAVGGATLLGALLRGPGSASQGTYRESRE